MKNDSPTIKLAPRTTAQCIDLSVMFLGRHLGSVLKLWLLTAGPAILVVHFLARQYEFTFLTALLVVFLASVPLGILLIQGMAAVALKEARKFPSPRNLLSPKGTKALLLGLINRILVALGLALFVIPGYVLALRSAIHFDEDVLSSSSGTAKADFYKKNKNRGELAFRAFWIVAFCSLLWLIITLTADFTCKLLFGTSPIWGRIEELMKSYSPAFSPQVFFDLLWYDPWVLSLLTATALLVYPLGRLALFFCYLDVRIRHDLWDVRWRFLHTARQLEHGA